MEGEREEEDRVVEFEVPEVGFEEELEVEDDYNRK